MEEALSEEAEVAAAKKAEDEVASNKKACMGLV